MLSSWGVGFDAVDVEADPSARAELARRGIPRVPAVIAGSRAVHGWNPRALAALVGVAYREPARLPPPELAARLDRVLAVAQRLIRQVPPAHLDARAVAGRDRSARQLAYHLFRLSLAFPDAIASRRFPEAWLAEEAPPDLADGRALAEYGGTARARLAAWLVRPDACDGVVETYYGPQEGPALLERTVWHAAQHVRQLTALLEALGVQPDDRLAARDLEGLPLPESLA